MPLGLCIPNIFVHLFNDVGMKYAIDCGARRKIKNANNLLPPSIVIIAADNTTCSGININWPSVPCKRSTN